jgi:hypothetical protein
LKCGGGKELTKQPSDETALRCHLTGDEAGKVVEGNALVVCNLPDSPKLEEKLEVTPIRIGTKLKIHDLGTVVAKLYDLEGSVEKERSVKIDLDLYQMENV